MAHKVFFVKIVKPVVAMGAGAAAVYVRARWRVSFPPPSLPSHSIIHQGYKEWEAAAQKLHLSRNKEEMEALFDEVYIQPGYSHHLRHEGSCPS